MVGGCKGRVHKGRRVQGQEGAKVGGHKSGSSQGQEGARAGGCKSGRAQKWEGTRAGECKPLSPLYPQFFVLSYPLYPHAFTALRPLHRRINLVKLSLPDILILGSTETLTRPYDMTYHVPLVLTE